MALITCPDCSKQVSDQAEICLDCGRPMKTAANKSTFTPDTRKFVPIKSKPYNNFGIGFAVYILLIFIGAFLRTISVETPSNALRPLIGTVIGGAGIVGLLFLLLRVIITLLQKI